MKKEFFLRIAFWQDGEKIETFLSIEEWFELFDEKSLATRWVAEKCC